MNALEPVWVALSSTPHSIGYIDAGPWRTRVLQAGSGEPLVMMHGTGGHLEAYAHNIAVLAERFRVIAFDFAGHGYTTPATEDLEISAYVGQVEALLDALGIAQASFTGESLGGWVAVKFAVAHPHRVRRLVLNTPGGTMATPEVMERIRALSQAAADDPTPERIRTRLEWLMADNATVTDELVRIRQAIYARPGFAESMRHILCLQDPEVRRRNLITDDELAAIIAPTVVVWTSDDPSGPAAAGMHMAERMPNGRFELIAGAGHWPQWEQHDTYNKLVADLAADVVTTSASDPNASATSSPSLPS
ncbi:MAG TPA: alpha/beta fold hydrolase [Pseudonocardia sp.]